MEQIDLIRKLKDQIEPTRDLPRSTIGIYYYPCGVILKKRMRKDHVFFVNKKDFMRHWGWMPKEEFIIHPEEVKDIYESPYRLPTELANKIYSWGETGMGYYRFYVEMKDGEKFPYITGDAVDLIELPEGYTTKDIEDVEKTPHRKKGKKIYRNKTYFWCLVDDL